MIQAKELRIGNLVERDGNILEVVRIAKDGIINYELVKEAQGMHVNSGSVIPIPLTEEWLLRFGFQKNEFEGFFLNGIVFYDGLLTANQKYKIQYVHQLQNLYFCLTGKELEATY